MSVPKKEKLIALKIYFDRAKMYLGYINFFILNIVLINSIDDDALKAYIQEYKLFIVPIMFIIYMGGLIFLGFLDTKLGLRREEMRNNAMMNPVITDLLKTVKNISVDVGEIKEKQNNPSQI
jgi:hypothetical protein